MRNEYEIVRTIPANQFLSKGRESVSDNNFGSMHGDIYLDSKTLFPFGRNDLFFTPNGVALPLCSVCYRLIRLD